MKGIIFLNESTITRVLEDPRFQKLDFIQTLKGAYQKTGCCGRKKFVQYDVFKRVASTAKFAEEILEVKAVLRSDKIVVSTPGFRREF